MSGTEVTPYGSGERKTAQVRSMFNNIAGTYDLLNRLLSLGIDKIWRRQAINMLKPYSPARILDVATGTGDFAIQAINTLHPVQVVGVDISEGMLEVAREKIAAQCLKNVYSVELANSEELPFEDNTFDAVTVAYGVRNFENLQQGINEMHRVLKQGGALMVLEFSEPEGKVVAGAFNFYFNKILPAVSSMISAEGSAYKYLPQSVAAFPSGRDFAQVLFNAGFKECKHLSQTFNISSAYLAEK